MSYPNIIYLSYLYYWRNIFICPAGNYFHSGCFGSGNPKYGRVNYVVRDSVKSIFGVGSAVSAVSPAKIPVLGGRI
jgi:hypothetical protein